MYSRSKLRKLMSISDSIEGLLNGKEPLDEDIEAYLEDAAKYIEMAVNTMEIEGGEYAAKRLAALQLSLPLKVDKESGEVLAEVGGKQEG